MKTILTFRGRVITEDDVKIICKLISDNPKDARYTLSNKLCELWDWRQPNGKLKASVCRTLMLKLHRAEHIALPEPRVKMGGQNRARPAKVTNIDESPIEDSLSALGELEIKQVRRSGEEKLFNSLIETHHYLGYTRPVGEHLKYMVWAQERPIACMAWCSPIQHLNIRDHHIGWTAEQRLANRHLIAYNTRYLIMPWVKVPHLASHLLGVFSRRISRDWEGLYNHPIYFLETFIEPNRYRGTCYLAANWLSLGKTEGRGIKNKTQKQLVPTKELLVYPLHKRYKKILCSGV